MPFKYDFSKLENLKEILIDIDGWVSPLIIEYGIGYHGENLSYFWRVKGTTHTFIIPVLRMDYLSEGNYKKHFQDILSEFREEYKDWARENWSTQWMREYQQQFSRFISI
jgi:hypothetical protein